ncbi:hypothetical protein [Streptomyces sp. NPDC055036]
MNPSERDSPSTDPSFKIHKGSEFLIWHARCRQDSAGTVCTFDVTSAGIGHIQHADRELVDAMTLALGLVGFTPQSWTAERFYSPYYAWSPDARAWEDRISIVWRMAIRLNRPDAAGTDFEYFGRIPTPVDQTDDTWDQSESSLEMTSADCIIIADGRHGDIERIREIFPSRTVSVLEYHDAVPITQIRINLGVLELPEQEELVRTGLSS